MKNSTTLVIGILVALIFGGGVGYVFGNSTNDTSATAEELEDSIVMMKEQSSNIQKMGEMMKSGGIAMQEIGMKYKDDGIISQGKDLEFFGEKYVNDNSSSSEDDSMKEIMH